MRVLALVVAATAASFCPCQVRQNPAADGLPVELVFGLLSPESSGAMHLQALASISRLVRDEAMRDDLIEAPNAEAMYALLTNATDRDAA